MSTSEELQILRSIEAKEGDILKLRGIRYRKLAGGRFEIISQEIPRLAQNSSSLTDTRSYSSSHDQRVEERRYELSREKPIRADRDRERSDPRNRPAVSNQYGDTVRTSASISAANTSRPEAPGPSSLRSAYQQPQAYDSGGYLPSSVPGTVERNADIPIRQQLPSTRETGDFGELGNRDPLRAPPGYPSSNPRTSGWDLLDPRPREQPQNTADDDDAEFTVLQGRLKAFAGFRFNDFEGRARYLAANTDLLKSKYSDLLKEAVLQIIDNDINAAQQCLQSLAILNLCQKVKSRRLQQEVLEMQSHDTEQKQEYEDAFTKLCKSARILAKEEVEKSARVLAKEEAETSKEPARQRLPPDPTPTSISRQRSTKSRHRKHDSKIEDLLALISTTDVVPVRTQDMKHLEPKDFESSQMRKLSANYRVPPNGRKFFVPGKVFAMLFHESAGADRRQGVSEERQKAAVKDQIDPNITIGPYGERIYSHIRRMVVIRDREGYSWCVGINSYGGQGLRRKNLKKKEIEAHTIIFDAESEAIRLEDEPETFKDPIAVVTVQGQTLTTASRLHYGKPYVVEWNQRVMEVGDVRADCLHSLLTDARIELLGDAPSGSSNR